MQCERCKQDIHAYPDEGRWYRDVYDAWLFPTQFRYGEDQPLDENDDDRADTKTFDGPYYSLCYTCWEQLRDMVFAFVTQPTTGS